MSISAVIHTFNSEKYLEECLESVKCADEIVICDMYSTDRTIEIAKKYNCKIIYHENIGFADPARNFALEHASGDWILVVDSDEVIPKALFDYLKNMISKPDCPDVFIIPRKNILLGKFLHSWYPNPIIRFFRKGCVKFSSYVHCPPKPQGKLYKIPPKYKELAIIHYNFDSIESFISRMNKYTTLELEKFEKRKTKFTLTYAIFRAWWEFLKRFILKQGYKDGRHGFIFATLMGYYKFIALTKLWQKELLESQSLDGIST